MMDGFDVVADCGDRKARAVEWFGRVAGRRGVTAAKHFSGDEEEFLGIEREFFADEPFVAVIVGHVVRRHEDDVVFGGVEMAVGAVDDFGLRESDAGFGFEIGDDKFVAFGGWSFGIGWLLSTSGGGEKE